MENNKVKDFVRSSLGYFAVALISAVYIAAALIRMSETGKTVSQIIADGAMTFFMGIIINRMMELQGMLNGDSMANVKATYMEHGKAVVRISPYIERLDGWCDEKTKEMLKYLRIKALASQGMKYDMYFDADGRAKDFYAVEPPPMARQAKKRWKKRLKCYNHALNIKLTPLTAGGLTSEGGRAGDPFYFGRTKRQYERQSSAQDALGKILTSLFFGYYGVELILNFNPAELLYRAMQIAIFIGMGVIKMYQAYMFITDEYRGRIIKKIDHLQMFENDILLLQKQQEQEAEKNALTENAQAEIKTEADIETDAETNTSAEPKNETEVK